MLRRIINEYEKHMTAEKNHKWMLIIAMNAKKRTKKLMTYFT